MGDDKFLARTASHAASIVPHNSSVPWRRGTAPRSVTVPGELAHAKHRDRSEGATCARRTSLAPSGTSLKRHAVAAFGASSADCARYVVTLRHGLVDSRTQDGVTLASAFLDNRLNVHWSSTVLLLSRRAFQRSAPFAG